MFPVHIADTLQPYMLYKSNVVYRLKITNCNILYNKNYNLALIYCTLFYDYGQQAEVEECAYSFVVKDKEPFPLSCVKGFFNKYKE